jgi:beta-glucanase (GH16 family)
VQWSTLSFTYGTVTVRAKMAGGSGTWPAIWLLGADCQNPSWLASYSCNWPSPGSNEIDIAEVLGSNHSRVNEQIHTTQSDGTYFLPNCDPAVNNLAWHTYTLVWAPGSLTWKVDGVQTCQMTTLVPSTPMFLIINTAVGGVGAAQVDTSTLPQETQVEYVRVTKSMS